MIETLVLAVSAAGALVVKRQIEAIGQAARDANGPVLSLNDALGAVLAGGALYKIGQQLNTLQNLRNGLQTVTGSALELEQAQNALFEVSQRTRSSWEDNIRVFVRVKRALEDYGVSSMEAINITESLNKALQVGGATGQERASVMLQLTQSMASGRVQGDELRSLLENSTILGNLLAKQLGVTRGEIRKLGSEGKISVTDLVMMFRNFSGEIDAAFAKTTPTIEQAFTTLRNEAVRALAVVDREFGISNGLVSFLQLVQANMEHIIRLAPAMGLALTSAFIMARSAGTSLLGVMGALAGTLLLNPFVATAAAIAAATAALYAYSDQISINEQDTSKLADVSAVVWMDLKGWIDGVIDSLGTLEYYLGPKVGGALSSFMGDFKLTGSIERELQGLARAADEIMRGYMAVDAGLTALMNNLAAKVSNAFKLMYNNIVKIISDLLDWANAQLAKIPILGGTGGPIQLTWRPEAYKMDAVVAGEDIAKSFNEGWAKAGSPVENYLNKVLKDAEHRRLGIEGFKSLGLKSDAMGTDALGVPGGPLKNVPTGGGGSESAARKLDRELDSIIKRSNGVAAAQLELSRAEDVLTRAVNAGKITMERKNQLLADMRLRLQDNLDPLGKINQDLDNEARALWMTNDQREVSNRLLQIENDLREKGIALSPTERAALEGRLGGLQVMKDQAQFVQQAFEGAFSQMGDALAEFVVTGKMDFRSLIQSMLRDLVKLMLQLLIIRPLMNAITGAFGGFGGGSYGTTGDISGGSFTAATSDPWSGLRGFATGGSFKVGGTGGVDSQLVAFRATPDETVNVTKPGQGGGGGTWNVKVVNQNGSDVRTSVDRQGQLEIMVANKVRDMVSNGDLNDVMGDVFAINPKIRTR